MSEVISLISFLKVEVRPAGIIALRSLPQSKMRNAFRYPLPSTLIGALAYPLLHIAGDRTETLEPKRNARSSADRIRPLIEWTTLKVSGKPRVYGSILKINRLHRGSVESAVTSFPMAVMYGESDYTLTLLYLLNDDLIRASEFSVKDFERAAWGISRLGSRESVVSVESVELGKGRIMEKEMAETAYAFPLTGKKVQGNGVVQGVIDWKEGIGNYSKARIIVMFYPEGKVKVEGRLRVIDVGEEVVL